MGAKKAKPTRTTVPHRCRAPLVKAGKRRRSAAPRPERLPRLRYSHGLRAWVSMDRQS
jgi:hypothetical protein